MSATNVDKAPGGQMARDRYAELKRILEERRREIMSEVHEKIRDVRAEKRSHQNRRPDDRDEQQSLERELRRKLNRHDRPIRRREQRSSLEEQPQIHSTERA